MKRTSKLLKNVMNERKIKMPETQHVPPPYSGLTFEQVLEKRKKFLSPSLSTFQAFKTPFYNTRGKMQYIWDYDDNRYLDLLAQNLTISCGHNHPRVVEAVKKQIDTLCHSTTMYYNESAALCAEELVKTFPKGHDWVVHFVNSGSEAVDLAIMEARAYTGNFDFISLRNSYHGLQGNAQGVTGVSTCKQNVPHNFGFFHTMQPDTYRGPFANDPNLAQKYGYELKELINHSTSGQISGFLYEQIQGYGGIYPLPKGYITECAKHVKKAGGLIIADEVQTGFGRSGDKYWAFELEEGIVPDIVVMAKGLGNGFPIAAVVSKREIAESITKRSFFNTYGGNPTMCAAGRAVLETIKADGLQENSKLVGDAFKAAVLRLQKKYPMIGDVRAQGLLLGIDIVKDPKTKEPDTKTALDIFDEMRDNGVVLGKSGREGNVLRILPPMCVNLEDVKFTEQVFDYVLAKHQK